MCCCISWCDRIKRAVSERNLSYSINCLFMWLNSCLQCCSLFWDYDIYTHNHQQLVGRGAKTRVHFRYFYLICVSFHQKLDEWMQDLFLCTGINVGVEQQNRATCACLFEADSVGKKLIQVFCRKQHWKSWIICAASTGSTHGTRINTQHAK